MSRASGQASADPRIPVFPVSGTAVIRGRVVADVRDADLPLENARISIGPAYEPVFTDRFGRFEIRGLPGGEYLLTAEKAGFARTQSGGGDLGPAMPVRLGDRAVVDGLEIRMPRGAAISGSISDVFGDPLAAATVRVSALEYVGESPRLADWRDLRVRTDDRGAYRVGGLARGDYVVMVDVDGGTYYPGTLAFSRAIPIHLDTGEDRSRIDIRLPETQPAQLVMTVLPVSDGPPVAQASVRISQIGAASSTAQRPGSSAGRTFEFASRSEPVQVTQMLPAADYVVQLRAGDRAALAVTALPPGGTVNVTLAAGAGSRMRGRVVFEEGPADPSSVRIHATGAGSFRGLDSSMLMIRGFAPARDGSFDVSGLFGSMLLAQQSAPSGWAVREIRAGGYDLLDTPVTFDEGSMLDDVRVVLTKDVAAVTGSAVDETGRPAPGCYIVLAPPGVVDPESPRIRLLRADQSGRFVMDGIIAGPYVAVAARDLDVARLRTRGTLEALRARGIDFTLREGINGVTVACAAITTP